MDLWLACGGSTRETDKSKLLQYVVMAEKLISFKLKVYSTSSNTDLCLLQWLSGKKQIPFLP